MPEAELKPWEHCYEFLSESTRIFRGFKMAADAKKLAFAFAGVILWALGAMLITVLSDYPQVLVGVAAIVATGIILTVYAWMELEWATKKLVVVLIGSIVALWIVAILLMVVVKDWTDLFDVFQLLWGLVVAAFFGTAIARIAALNATTDDTVGPRAAIRFALRKFTTTFWALVMPIIAALAFGIIVALMSVLGRVTAVGAIWYIVIGILYIIPLLFGLLFSAILLVYTPSLLLFQPVIAVEGNDSFEAVSTSYSFVATKPWRLGFYALLAAGYGWIIMRVAAMLFIGAGMIVNWFMGNSMGHERIGVDLASLDLRAILGSPWQFWWFPTFNGIAHFTGGHVIESFKGTDSVGGGLIMAWQHLLLVLFLAFGVSLFYSLITQIFILMRKAVYGTPFEEVYIETSEEEQFAAEFAGTPIPAKVTPLAASAGKEPAKSSTPPKPEIGPLDKPIDLVEPNKPPDKSK